MRQVFVSAELQRIHEDGHDDNRAGDLGLTDQLDVPGVQSTHRRNQRHLATHSAQCLRHTPNHVRLVVHCQFAALVSALQITHDGHLPFQSRCRTIRWGRPPAGPIARTSLDIRLQAPGRDPSVLVNVSRQPRHHREPPDPSMPTGRVAVRCPGLRREVAAKPARQLPGIAVDQLLTEQLISLQRRAQRLDGIHDQRDEVITAVRQCSVVERSVLLADANRFAADLEDQGLSDRVPDVICRGDPEARRRQPCGVLVMPGERHRRMDSQRQRAQFRQRSKDGNPAGTGRGRRASRA